MAFCCRPIKVRSPLLWSFAKPINEPVRFFPKNKSKPLSERFPPVPSCALTISFFYMIFPGFRIARDSRVKHVHLTSEMRAPDV